MTEGNEEDISSEHLSEVLQIIEDVSHEWSGAINALRELPMYYYRDGTPIVSSDPADPRGTRIWAALFEDFKGRTIGQTISPYGEKLSTVWLGLDHNFMGEGAPVIFESMLFAPVSEELRRARLDRLGSIRRRLEAGEEETYNKKHYPHDGLQRRYSTEAQAKAGHRTLKLQCLIPPRWRRFLLYTIGRDSLWS